MPNFRTLFIDTNKDVRILIYFSNTGGVREEGSLGNIATSNLSVLSVKVQPTVRDSALWPKMLGKVKRNMWKNWCKEHVISLLQETVDILQYAVYNCCNCRCEYTVVVLHW